MDQGSGAPSALISMAIEPGCEADRVAFADALAALAATDAEISVRVEAGSGPGIIGASDEAHLRAAVDALRRSFRGALVTGAPRIAYRETLSQRVETDFTYKKRTGGRDWFARVRLVFEPSASGAGSAPRRSPAAPCPRTTSPASRRASPTS